MDSRVADAPLPGAERRQSLIIGGPFHGLLARVRLLDADGFPGWRCVLALAALAWGLPAVLALLQDLVAGDGTGLGYFADPSTVARFVVGVAALVVVERRADQRLTLLADGFRNARLLGEADMPVLARVLEAADRRTSSRWAEALMLAIALAVPGALFDYILATDPHAWEGRLVDGEPRLTWAGTAVRFFSAPLFEFLILRWFWRFACWSHLLLRLSRLPLRLTVAHPDRLGGLGFVTAYPPVFNGCVFAISAAIAAGMIRDLAVETVALQTVQMVVGFWVAMAVVITVGPLLVFTPCLMALKDAAVRHYGRLAAEVNQAFERRWLGDAAADGGGLLASSEASAALDANALIGAVWSLRVFAVDLGAVVSVALAAGAPMLVVLVTEMPIQELLAALLSFVV